MRAVVDERYGGPEVLELRDVPTPAPSAGEVLVEVVATSINLSDWESLRGTPATRAWVGCGGRLTPSSAPTLPAE